MADGVWNHPSVERWSMHVDWAPAPFARTHRWDRNFHLLMIGLVWLGVLMGFVPEIVRRLHAHAPPYPAVIHVHAVLFVAWLGLLTTQVVLVRSRRTDLHMKLGRVGLYLYPLMVVIGLAAVVVSDRLHAGRPGSDTRFLSIQLADLLNFAVMASAAFAWRRIPSAHKRLILLATIFISNAGFSRWWAEPILHWITRHHGVPGYWGYAAVMFLSDVLLVLMMGAYDLVTRRRLHPAFVAGASFGLLVEALAIGLYVSPWWKPVALGLIGL